MIDKDLREWFSDSRLKKYFDNTPNGQVEDFYIWSQKLNNAFFADIAYLEVLMRTKIDQGMHSYYANKCGQGYWWDREGVCNKTSLHNIDKTIARIKKEKKIIPQREDIVAGLNFDFWRYLFPRRTSVVYDILQESKVFQLNFKEYKRFTFMLNSIYRVRNRIAHHESIFNHNPGSILGDIRSLTEVFSIPASNWIKKQSEVTRLIAYGIENGYLK